MARDLLLHYGQAVPIARATEDVDLAFPVADWREFDVLRAALIDSRMFRPARPAHRLLYQDRVPIDLIPFGGVEAPNGRIMWPADETVMGVLGYREALATAIEVMLPESQRVLTISLPMLVMLKLLAWSERHVVHPRKDASDLFFILKHYLNKENTERLYREAAHLLEAEDFDYEAAGGWLAGHDGATQVSACSPDPEGFLDACDVVLSAQAAPNGGLELIAETSMDATVGLRLLRSLLDGMRAGRNQRNVRP